MIYGSCTRSNHTLALSNTQRHRQNPRTNQHTSTDGRKLDTNVSPAAPTDLWPFESETEGPPPPQTESPFRRISCYTRTHIRIHITALRTQQNCVRTWHITTHTATNMYMLCYSQTMCESYGRAYYGTMIWSSAECVWRCGWVGGRVRSYIWMCQCVCGFV